MDITTFLNLMVVLVPFLLITAVFSRITIMELDMPAGAAASNSKKPKVKVEVIVREKSLQIANGRNVIANIPNVEDDKYDLKTLTSNLMKIKEAYPDKTDANILIEADIEYHVMILVMDAVRNAEVENPDAMGGLEKVALFPDMSLGDAP